VRFRAPTECGGDGGVCIFKSVDFDVRNLADRAIVVTVSLITCHRLCERSGEFAAVPLRGLRPPAAGLSCRDIATARINQRSRVQL